MSRTCACLALTLATLLPATSGAAVLDVGGLSKDVPACDDFNAYANGGWLATTTIPPDRSSWSTFDIITRRNAERIEVLFTSATRANPYPPGSNRHKVVEYYASGMDEAAIAKAGLAPLAPLFAAIEAARHPDDLPKVLATLHRAGIRAGFSFIVRQDAKDSRRYLAEIQQGGLVMPERDYYFRDDTRSEAQREAYWEYLRTLMRAGGESPRAVHYLSGAVMGLEKKLAAAQMTVVERRDPEKTYNRREVRRLAEEAPGFDWLAYFAELGVRDLAEVNVAQPRFATAFAALARSEPVEDWRAYLRWHVLDAAATKLSPAFEEAHFAFHQRVLMGMAEAPPRARRVIETISGRYGSEPLAHAIGEMFVEDSFRGEAKSRALELVGHVKAALRESLLGNDWMEEATRKAALEKLDRMAVKIGYPDRWRDFSSAPVGARLYAENWLAANAYEFRRTLAQLGKPVERGAWRMSPHIVNAYYGSSLNEIVFPAGILQPPFFDPGADDAVNFGGIGMVIGHEITHGFDDRGRRYDAEGNLREWWTPADQKRYNARAQAVVGKYSAYAGVDGLKVNGSLTLGDNLSDIGGLHIAYLGLQRALEGKSRAAIDGLTPEQRFFVSFAQSWRSRVRPEYERLRLLTDGHSPPRYRVQGPLANLPEFARAFSCPAGAKALRAQSERVNLW